MPDNRVSVAQYAAHHGLTRQVVYKWLHSGRLRGRRINGRMVILTPLINPPPIGYCGNPNFTDSAYQSELASRPRKRRRKN